MDEQKQGIAARNNYKLKARGSKLKYEDFNASDRWSFNYNVRERARFTNPYGKGNFDVSEFDGAERAANTKAQAAPPPHGALSFNTGRVTTAATTIATPKETVDRKVLPRVSARMKQKAANLRAGIRT